MTTEATMTMTMTGTAKQVAWAEAIKAKSIAQHAATTFARVKGARTPEQMSAKGHDCLSWDAAWWIGIETNDAGIVTDKVLHAAMQARKAELLAWASAK